MSVVETWEPHSCGDRHSLFWKIVKEKPKQDSRLGQRRGQVAKDNEKSSVKHLMGTNF